MNDEINFLETKFHDNTLPINLDESLLYHIDGFLEKGYVFSHIDEMKISTNIDKCIMTNDYYIQHLMQAVELNLNVILAKNPHLIQSLKRSHDHPLIRKYSHMPVNNY